VINKFHEPLLKTKKESVPTFINIVQSTLPIDYKLLSRYMSCGDKKSFQKKDMQMKLSKKN
jgi:hypothetical protein